MIKTFIIALFCIYGVAMLIHSSGPDFRQMAQDRNSSTLAKTLTNVAINDDQRIRFLNNHFKYNSHNQDSHFNQIVVKLLNNTNLQNGEKVHMLAKFMNHLSNYNSVFESRVRKLNFTRDSFTNIKQKLVNSSLIYSMNEGLDNQALYVQLPGIGEHVLIIEVSTRLFNNYHLDNFFVKLFFPLSEKAIRRFNESTKIDLNDFYYEGTYYFGSNTDALTKFVSFVSNIADSGNLERPSINDAKSLRDYGYMIDLLD